MSSDVKISRFTNIDILKCLCAFMVVCLHVPLPNPAGSIIITLSRTAVPIFFMITGFFYSDTVERNDEKRQIVKILKLIVFSNLAYFIWNLMIGTVVYILSGDVNSFAHIVNIFNMFSKNAVEIFLCNVSPFAGHLWYLNAILYVLVVAYIMRKSGKFKVLYYLTPVLLCADLIFGKYSVAIFGKSFGVVYVRNFLCVGIPYFMLGNAIRYAYVHHNKESVFCRKSLLILGTVIFAVLCVAENHIIVSLGINSERDHYITTTFLACMLFILFLNLFKNINDKNIFAVIGRKYSSLIYILHIMVRTVFNIAAKVLPFGTVYSYVAPVAVFAATAVIAVLYSKLIHIRKTK